MKYVAMVSLLLNVFIFFAWYDSNYRVETQPGLAKFATYQILKKRALLPEGERIQINACAEQDGSGMKISASGNNQIQTLLLNGMLVTKKIRFRYDASVNRTCSPVNLNCYNVSHLNFDGNTQFEPRL